MAKLTSCPKELIIQGGERPVRDLADELRGIDGESTTEGG